MALAVIENRQIVGAEAIAERPDGTRVPFLAYPTPLRDRDGNVVGSVNMLVDISDRKRGEERQRALLDEINHRVKNTLATVQALASQTLRGEAVPAEARDAFAGRLFAISQVHNQLTRDRWESADLKAILDSYFAVHLADDPVRVKLSGDAVDLPPRTALTVAMVLHELLANAVRHGALASPDGRLDVTWGATRNGADRRLRIDWVEAGGPSVEPPRNRGFGLKYLERGITQELKGTVSIAFDPDGLRCSILVPLKPPHG